MELIAPGRLTDLFPMNGYTLVKAESEHREEDDFRTYSLRIHKPEGEFVIRFTIPEADTDGVIRVKQNYKVVIRRGARGANYDLGPRTLANVWVQSQEDVVKHMLRDAMAYAFRSPTPDVERLQSRVDAFFATSDLTRYVDPDKPIDVELSKDLILIDTVTSPLDYRHRLYDDWHGKIDIITTSVGSNVGQVYRMARGAKVRNGRIIAGKSPFSDTMHKYLLFPENNRPDRLLMVRSVFGRHETLTDPEEPYVAHKSYDGALSGVQLLTGIVSHPLNYYDCIVVSQSAADRLVCKKVTRQVVIDTVPYEVLVKVGDRVRPGQELMKHEGKTIAASRLKGSSKLLSVNVTGTRIGIINAIRWVFRFETTYPMMEGCKLSSRHSTKGVVRVLNDTDMPHIIRKKQRVTVTQAQDMWSARHREMADQLNDWARTPCVIMPVPAPPEDPGELAAEVPGLVCHDGRLHKVECSTLEVLIHPRSILGRRNYGAVREMVLNKMVEATAEKTGHLVPLSVEHFSDEESLPELAHVDLSNDEPIYNEQGEQIGDAFCGPLYWLRTDKHAVDQFSAIGADKPVDAYGMNPDTGRAGQRLGLDAAIVLEAKGMVRTMEEIMRVSAEPGAVETVHRLLECIQ